MPGVSTPFAIEIPLVFDPATNISSFTSTEYFPADGRGFNDTVHTGSYGTVTNHNFLFTTKITLKFTYFGGEVFTFFGDDDVWVFINRQVRLIEID